MSSYSIFLFFAEKTEFYLATFFILKMRKFQIFLNWGFFMLYVLKVAITASLVILIAEVSKRNTLMAGIYASIPLTSVLAMIWLYIDTTDASKVASLSWDVLKAVIPSYAFLIALPVFIKIGLNFWFSLLIATLLTLLAYYIYVLIFG